MKKTNRRQRAEPAEPGNTVLAGLALAFAALGGVVLLGVIYYVAAVHAVRIRSATTDAACLVTGCNSVAMAVLGYLLFAGPYLCVASLVRFWERLHVVYWGLLVIAAFTLALFAMPWAGFLGLGEWSDIISAELGTGALWATLGLVWPLASWRSADFRKATRRFFVTTHAIPMGLALAAAMIAAA